MSISEKNLKEFEKIISTFKGNLGDYYLDDELYSIMELTKKKRVFLKCMKDISIPYLEGKIKDPRTNQTMIFKLTQHPHSMIQSAILNREDVTIPMLKQILGNYESEEIEPMRYPIINHKKMTEETLYELSDSENNQILSLILLTNKVSDRIIKKLQNSNDEEIRTMAKVRDPETDPEYIETIIKREIKKADKIENDYISREYHHTKPFLINDILEAAIRNPKLPTELVELYKKFSKPALITLVIPHPNISKELLDFYYEKGDKEIKEAVSERRREEPSL